MWQTENILEMFATFLKYMPSGDPTILRIHEKRRGTGEIHKQICQIRQRRTKMRGHKESILTDYHSLHEIYLESFPIQKQFFNLFFLSP